MGSGQSSSSPNHHLGRCERKTNENNKLLTWYKYIEVETVKFFSLHPHSPLHSSPLLSHLLASFFVFFLSTLTCHTHQPTLKQQSWFTSPNSLLWLPLHASLLLILVRSTTMLKSRERSFNETKWPQLLSDQSTHAQAMSMPALLTPAPSSADQRP